MGSQHPGLPAIVLDNPKLARNVGAALRNAYNFGVQSMFITGYRVGLDPTKGERLPIEERFREYSVVSLKREQRPVDLFPKGTPVIGVELVPGAQPLSYFQHPDEAIYCFGAEDGGISKGLRHMCHSFVYIPTLSCLNLAVATGVILYDRTVKMQLAGKMPVLPMEEQLARYQYSHEMDSIDAGEAL